MVKYTFRTLVPEDKALFMGWLAEPHIGGWWSEPEQQWAHVEAHWAETPQSTVMQVAQADGTDFAYVQSYNAHAYPMPHYSDRPETAQAIDCFLGAAPYLAQGHGSGFIRARAQHLIAGGAACVLVDPDVLNTHAIGSYTRAGFVPVEERQSNEDVSVLVMEFTGDTPI